MGEYDLMSLAFTLDLGFYYLGIASQPFKMGMKALLVPPFSDGVSLPFFLLIRAYNRRFAQIARRRRRVGTLGKTNRGRRCLIPGFTLKSTDIGQLVKAMAKWIWLELTEGWHSWGETKAEQPAGVVSKSVPSIN
jgi:hypothetical protein